MEKFIQPRGTGRTYNICKYAIENDCDIISPSTCSMDNCLETLKNICWQSNGKYVLCKISTGNVLKAIVFRRETEDLVMIRICYAWRTKSIYDPSRPTRNFVADDVDICLSKALDVPIKAVSIESYAPADVALKGGVSAD